MIEPGNVGFINILGTLAMVRIPSSFSRRVVDYDFRHLDIELEWIRIAHWVRDDPNLRAVLPKFASVWQVLYDAVTEVDSHDSVRWDHLCPSYRPWREQP